MENFLMMMISPVHLLFVVLLGKSSKILDNCQLLELLAYPGEQIHMNVQLKMIQQVQKMVFLELKCGILLDKGCLISL